jgi:hypothetical protein
MVHSDELRSAESEPHFSIAVSVTAEFAFPPYEQPRTVARRRDADVVFADAAIGLDLDTSASAPRRALSMRTIPGGIRAATLAGIGGVERGSVIMKS